MQNVWPLGSGHCVKHNIRKGVSTWNCRGLEILQVPWLEAEANWELQGAPCQGIDGLPVDVSPVLNIHYAPSACA